ncbi:3'-5' exoribonuclease YhaM family protein [Thermincola potens]|uniref:Metal dependent phosphohydrolase n=1 Tax=Thermincola potens (strain JR) TaxID=635013 RepID=D5X8H9_THEPJ|nr:HD domain-containing protein [Thermincola potens]ADG82855.1 metal dependent phosphohydrolase [Thermincola potens JR]
MKTKYIADLKPGDNVDDLFFVKSVKVLNYKNKPGRYVSLILSDRTGEIAAKIWDGDDKDFELPEKVFVGCKGEVVEFAGTPEIQISSWELIDKAAVDSADFIPLTPLDVGNMQKDVAGMASSMTNPYLRQLLEELINDKELFHQYSTVPAAKAIHQAYIGGLLEHSLKTAKIASYIANLYPAVNKELAITGALLHDIGKIEEYEVEYSIEVADKGRLLGHIVLGLEIINSLIERVPGFPEDLRLALQHIIVSHHGTYEWQSPKRPKTIEACLVHYADAVEADMWKFSDLKEKYQGSRWSPWDKSLERYVFLDDTATNQ